MKNLISEFNLEDCVKLKGISNNIIEEYCNCAGLIMTSRYEGFPLALIEAQSCGLPLIAFDCPHGPSEIINEGKNGFLIPMGDYKQLIEKICRLANDLDLRKAFSANAFIYSKRYCVDNIISDWEDLFNNLK